MAYITITPHVGTVRVFWGDREVAASDCALDLVEGGGRPVIYVPRADADMSLFEPTRKHTQCPHKGEASYFTLHADGQSAAMRSGPTRRRSKLLRRSPGISPSTRPWCASRLEGKGDRALAVSRKVIRPAPPAAPPGARSSARR